MSSIADALKRAEDERRQMRLEETQISDRTSRPNPLEQSRSGRPARITPLTDALRQAPAVPNAAIQAHQETADTIVEDYAAKRTLNLPASLIVYHDRSGPAAEQYRKIRDTLMAANPKREPQMLVLTSAVPAEGKTTTLLNLALALVELRGNKVLLVDACLRDHTHTARPSLTAILKMQHQPGLAEMLADSAEIAETFIRPTPWHHLYILPSGAKTAPAAAVDLLKSPAARTSFHRLRATADWLLVDTPAALAMPDAGLLGTLADGVILTAALHHTPDRKIQTALRRLRSINVPVRACILTRA